MAVLSLLIRGGENASFEYHEDTLCPGAVFIEHVPQGPEGVHLSSYMT